MIWSYNAGRSARSNAATGATVVVVVGAAVVVVAVAAVVVGGGAVVATGLSCSSTVMLLDQGAEWRLFTNGLPESIIARPGTLPGRYVEARWLGFLRHNLKEKAGNDQ